MAKILYDTERELARIRNAIVTLRSSERPGAVTGRAGQRDILRSVLDDIRMLVSDGYTSAQIATALATQEFAILPRAITELVTEKKAKKPTKRTPRGAPRGTPGGASGAAHAAPIKAEQTTTQAAGQFELKRDAF